MGRGRSSLRGTHSQVLSAPPQPVSAALALWTCNPPAAPRVQTGRCLSPSEHGAGTEAGELLLRVSIPPFTQGPSPGPTGQARANRLPRRELGPTAPWDRACCFRATPWSWGAGPTPLLVLVISDHLHTYVLPASNSIHVSSAFPGPRKQGRLRVSPPHCRALLSLRAEPVIAHDGSCSL